MFWKRFRRRAAAGMLSAALVLSGAVGLASMDARAETAAGEVSDDSARTAVQMPFRDLTADEIVAEMGTGWNLGNTMDGHTGFTPGETVWQSVETTQELIKSIHDMGFNTIRVPVTWGTMIDDDNDYAIDERWISRVQDIVDYAINMNMYVIINIHHDGAEQTGWLRVAAEDFEPVKEKYEKVWEHIAERFKDYDEHLIFESMNEVCGDSTTTVEGDTARIMELNQIFVDTVRATGSNNEYRWLSVPGRYTNIANTTNPNMGFDIPDDPTPNRIFVSVHYYDWTFGMLESMVQTEWLERNFQAVVEDFRKLYDTFTSKGIPVILGEYGTVNKLNDVERAYHCEGVNRICQNYGIVPVYWDQGWYDLSMEPDYSFTLVDRETGEEIYPVINDAILRGMYLEGAEDLSDIEKGPEVNAITDLGEISGTLSLNMGTVSEITLENAVDKSAYNDVILWKSADETVATVNAYSADNSVWAANIHATGIGRTVITAYSRSGGAALEIPVEVHPADAEVACENISLPGGDSYTLEEEQYVYLNACISPADSDTFLTYRSSDPEVVTVSKLGKVLAKSAGTAYIVITSSDGAVTKVVPVTVTEAEQKEEISLALNVYYNDSNLNYFSNEVGEAVTVYGDGQYKLTFDCASDLSGSAVSAGVTGLNNLTSIYIKDDSVTQGLTKKSPLVSCDIQYDELLIDGVSYAITQDAPKSALKTSGILDTNDPINSWDGSVIEEVTVSNYVLNFSEHENPQKIELTFTLSNLVFDETAIQETADPVAAESIEAEGAVSAVSNDNPGELRVTVDPAGSGKVLFVSSDPGTAYVENLAVEPDEAGAASTKIYGLADGNAVITAYTENGLTCEISVDAEYAPQAIQIASSDSAAEQEDSEPESEAVDSDAASVTEEAPEETTGNNEMEAAEEESGYSAGMIIGFVALCIVLFVGVFFGTMKLAGGSKKKS